MASACHFFNNVQRGPLRQIPNRVSESSMPSNRQNPNRRHQFLSLGKSFPAIRASLNLEPTRSNATLSSMPFDPFDIVKQTELSNALQPQAATDVADSLFVADLDPETAKVVILFLGPALSAFSFLFILRIVMSWYPKLPVGKFPYVIAYAPTEPILVQTRKLIPPVGGVDVTPVVWFGLISFLNEILLGPQGLLVLVSQQAR